MQAISDGRKKQNVLLHLHDIMATLVAFKSSTSSSNTVLEGAIAESPSPTAVVFEDGCCIADLDRCIDDCYKHGIADSPDLGILRQITVAGITLEIDFCHCCYGFMHLRVSQRTLPPSH